MSRLNRQGIPDLRTGEKWVLREENWGHLNA